MAALALYKDSLSRGTLIGSFNENFRARDSLAHQMTVLTFCVLVRKFEHKFDFLWLLLMLYSLIKRVLFIGALHRCKRILSGFALKASRELQGNLNAVRQEFNTILGYCKAIGADLKLDDRRWIRSQIVKNWLYLLCFFHQGERLWDIVFGPLAIHGTLTTTCVHSLFFIDDLRQ